jgi:ABC-type transporter Mla MlaB component
MTAPKSTRMSLPPGNELRITCTGNPPGLAITGEVDESSYSSFVRALARFTGGQSEIHIDLAGLLYCDIAGLRAIVDLTGARGRSGQDCRRVVLHEVPPQLRAALRIVGWDATPGLVLHERIDSIRPLPGGVAAGATSVGPRVSGTSLPAIGVPPKATRTPDLIAGSWPPRR